MKLALLIGPVASATVVNVFLVALVWRDQQRERATGRGLRWLWPVALAYGFGLATFAYFRGLATSDSGLELFLIAAGAELLGATIVYAILHAFLFSRGQALKDRAFAFVLVAVMLAVAVGGIFAKP